MMGSCIPRSEQETVSKQIDKELKESFKKFRDTIKILLLGTGESGKTTIIKQMKILHINGFTEEERIEKTKEIRQNIHESIYTLILHMPLLKINFDNTENQNRADYILKLGETLPENCKLDYYKHVKLLWMDSGIQLCYHRSNEFQLIDSAKYFLDKIDKIARTDYSPSIDEILHSRKMTKGIHEIKFSIKGMNFCMFDVGGQRDQRKKWFQVFDGIEAVLFIISCADFDKKLREDQSENRLTESIRLFEHVWHNRFLMEAGLIVFLNKQDLLEEKIRLGNRIGHYFPEYENFQSSNAFDEAERTRRFIKHKLQCIENVKPRGITKDTKERQCYYHYTVATDTDNIRKVFHDVQHLILEIKVAQAGLYIN